MVVIAAAEVIVLWAAQSFQVQLPWPITGYATPGFEFPGSAFGLPGVLAGLADWLGWLARILFLPFRAT
jgi:hypothetical protein